jgi:hypothetical protein
VLLMSAIMSSFRTYQYVQIDVIMLCELLVMSRRVRTRSRTLRVVVTSAFNPTGFCSLLRD